MSKPAKSSPASAAQESGQSGLMLAVLALSAVGLAASIYLTQLHQQIFTGKLEDFGFCGISRQISCEAVSASPYASILGVPLAWLGVLLYLFWIALAAAGANKPAQHGRLATGLLLATAGAAVLFNLYLGQLMFFRMQAICLLCLLTYLVNLIILLLAAKMAKGEALSTATSAIRSIIPFSGGTRYGFVLIAVGIIAIGVIGQLQMQKGIAEASKFDADGFRKYQDEAKRLTVNAAADPFHGGADAGLTIVEFSDFQCPHCRKGHVVLQTVLAGYGDRIKFVFKNLPLPFHHSARPLAELGEAAHRQGKFWPLHDLVFERQESFKETPLDRAGLLQLARDAGLDMAQLEKDLADPAVMAAVEADLQESIRLGIKSTPVLLLNGLLLRGVPPPAILKQIIDLELERAKRAGQAAGSGAAAAG